MNQLTMEEIKFLNEKAKNIRIDILTVSYTHLRAHET